MTVNGTAYRLPNLARTITEIGSGLLPTPTAGDHKSVQMSDALVMRRAKTHSRGIRLSEAMHRERLAIQYWPTPSAGDDRDRGNLSLPSIQRRAALGKQLNLSMVVSMDSGALNPMWVEWLMGFPIGHTDLKDSETP